MLTFNKLTYPQKNLLRCLQYVLRMHKIKFTSHTLKNSLFNHPDFPSLVSLGDVLNELNVSTLAVNISQERLPEIPLPAIVHLDASDGFFAPVIHISEDKIKWHHTNFGLQEETLADFASKWNGTVLLIQLNENSGETNYRHNLLLQLKQRIYTGLSFSGVFLALAIMIYTSFAGYPHTRTDYLLLILHVLGIFISGAVIINSLVRKVKIKKICPIGYVTITYNDLKKDIDWHTVSLYAFSGALITILLSNLLGNSRSLNYYLAGVSLLPLVYQIVSFKTGLKDTKHRLRKLTILTLQGSGIMVLPGASNFHALISGISIPDISILAFSYMLVPSIYAFFRLMFISLSNSNIVIRDQRDLKFSTDYINYLFKRPATVPPTFQDMGVIKYGSNDALHTLTVVVDPFCNYCAETVGQLKTLLSRSPEIKCEIILTGTNSIGDISGEVSRKLLSLPAEQGFQELAHWYKIDGNKAKKWDKWNIEESENSRKFLDLHRLWCDLANIYYSPAYLLNGVLISDQYRMEDTELLLKYVESGVVINKQ